jgi:hypothetical protein
MIDEENLDWRFGRFKFQSKLFFDRAENRETHRIGCGASFGGIFRCVGSPFQIKSPCEFGPVDDRSVEPGSR